MNAARVPVLMYHRVGDVADAAEARYAIPADRFRAHMEALARAGHCAVGIDALVDWLEGGRPVPDRSFVLTFDDGFAGVHKHAMPVLERLGWPLTVFLVSDLIGGHARWMEGSASREAHQRLLNAGEIREMQRRGCSFHSHSRTHPTLTRLDEARLESEVSESRQVLSGVLGVDVTYFAYPYGQVDERVESATRRAGYRAAFSTQSGFNRRGVDLFRIRRLDVFGTDTPAMLLRKIHLGCNDGSLAYAARYYLGRLLSRVTRAGQP